ncbi:VWA domain-containing protein [Faecousia sp. CLA-AA-H192]|uniref:VWA domain-containing protein n=1 Tax=Faecousia intestinalis TaxID=3133167 RepID=A0ABV1G6W9_9FIRM
MKRIKRTLAALLIVVLTLALLGEAVFADNSEQPVWPEEGAIRLSKSAAAVEGKENTWEVTLGIQGKNYKTTSDVVLVIDNSNSMYDNSRMAKTKAAANAFVDTLLTEDSTTRIALVVYNLKETHTGFYAYANRAALKQQINAITQNNDDGGTFTQLGLHTARTLLNSAESTGQNKNIVLLSDGEPTKAYEFVAKNPTYTGCESWHLISGHHGGTFKAETFEPNYSLTLGDGRTNDFGTYSYNAIARSVTCNKDVSKDIDCNYYKDSSGNWVYTTNEVETDLGVPTMWEAEQATAEGTIVYTVAFQAGTDGERVLKACATNPTKGFFAISSSTNIETALKDAFTSIAGSISIAARAGSVADTMGDKVQLVFKDAAPIITTDMAVYAAGNADVYISQGTASYDSATRAIHWTVGNVSEQDKPVMKYRVTIKSGCNPSTGETLLTNEQATFSYIDYLGRDAEAEFPKPEVTVGGGKLLVHWYQVNDKGQPVNAQGTVVESPALAHQVQPAEYHSVNGSTGLRYNTPYTVDHKIFDGYTYYGSYILNDGSPTEGDSATVTLTAVSSNQDLWFAYGRDFKVAHVQNGTVVQTDTHAVTEHFDLTAQVLTGHLYGGAFSAEACGEDNVQSFAAGQNAMDFTPEAGATYYIWEPSDVYLAPRNYNAWQHVYGGSNGERGVIATYLLTTIDRTLYQEVGFLSGGSSYVSEKDGASIAYGVVNANKNGTLYQQLFVRNGILNATEGLEATSRDDGYIGLYRWTDGAFYQKDAAFSFQPYWITLDGIRVTGTSVRTCTYRGTGTTDDHQSLGISAKTTGSACTVVSAAETTIHFAETYSLDAATDAPVAPPEPEPETVTLTLHEGTSTRSITVPTGDQRGKVAPAELGGKVFAGWYTDDAYRTPADLSNVQENRTLYGKYVSYNYLRVEYQRNSFLQGNSITLLSAVDGRGFAETGFVINGKRVAVPQLTERFRVFTAQMVFGRSVSRDALLMTMPYSLQGLQRGAAIEITPYWVTPDGTTVYGEARTLIYEYFTLRG